MLTAPALIPLGQPDTPTVEEAAGSVQRIIDTAVASLPRAAVGLVILLFFVAAGRALRPLVRKRLSKSRTPSFARVFAKLTSSASTVIGTLLALTAVFPSVRPVDVLAGAGVLTVAVGFAFQDILQNLLAGILLLFRQPFRGGDQIFVGEHSGTVEEINIRETVITTFDGRRVLIPNAKVYTDIIKVQTAHPTIRASFVVGIGYDDDMAHARQVAVDAISAVDGIAAAPPPEAMFKDLGPATVDLEVLFWCDSRQIEMLRAVDRAIEAVKDAFDREGISMPTQIFTVEAPAPPSAA